MFLVFSFFINLFFQILVGNIFCSFKNCIIFFPAPSIIELVIKIRILYIYIYIYICVCVCVCVCVCEEKYK